MDNAVATVVILGVGVAYSIFVLSWYFRRGQKAESETAIRLALREELQRKTVEALAEEEQWSPFWLAHFEANDVPEDERLFWADDFWMYFSHLAETLVSGMDPYNYVLVEKKFKCFEVQFITKSMVTGEVLFEYTAIYTSVGHIWVTFDGGFLTPQQELETIQRVTHLIRLIASNAAREANLDTEIYA